MPAGGGLTSGRQMAMDLSNNQNTIKRAYMTLEQEGLLYPVKGKGNFVAETRQIQEKSKEYFRKEFLALVRRGINTGMTEEELMTLFKKGYEEEHR